MTQGTGDDKRHVVSLEKVTEVTEWRANWERSVKISSRESAGKKKGAEKEGGKGG